MTYAVWSRPLSAAGGGESVKSVNGHQFVALHVGWQGAQRRSQVGWLAAGRIGIHVAAPTGQAQRVGCERKRVEAVGFLVELAQRDVGVLVKADRHMDVDFLVPLYGMTKVKIERKRVEELELLIVLKDLGLLAQGPAFRIRSQLVLQVPLPVKLPRQHRLELRAMGIRDG